MKDRLGINAHLMVEARLWAAAASLGIMWARIDVDSRILSRWALCYVILTPVARELQPESPVSVQGCHTPLTDPYQQTEVGVMPWNRSVIFPYGTPIGRWTVIGEAIRIKRYWYSPCRCRCGTERQVRVDHLSSGATQSCGCLSSEVTTARNFKHGANIRENRTLLYGVFASMIARCENSNVESYMNYGARGISVCDEWRHDFSQFKKWALETGYRENLTIERKDNNGNYSPQNCIWIPFKLQARNKRSNHYVTLFGETKILEDWFKDSRCAVDKSTFYRRIHRGLSEEQALITPSFRPWLRRSPHTEFS
jgi:hypothetical protein